MVTDARGGSSPRSGEEVQQCLEEADVPIYVAVVESHDGRTPLSRDMTGLAQESEGRIRKIGNPEDFSAIYARPLGDQAGSYAFGFPPRPGSDGEREGEVRVRDRRLRVKARRGDFHGKERGAKETGAPQDARR
ncbi:MAG: hypothetical protein Q9Q13_07860 [Acidobacteriota bacterium]|nr:hypothetical protein [Acidobacteriota bacterium]